MTNREGEAAIHTTALIFRLLSFFSANQLPDFGSWVQCASRHRGGAGPVCLVFIGLTLGLFLVAGSAGAQSGPELGFSRLRPGWTNYSTAFLATHDLGSDDFATVAALYTPRCDVTPVEYAAVFIWEGAPGTPVPWAGFSFSVHIWSGLPAFLGSPRRGDVAATFFSAPTGGSTTVPDAWTRGGRPAWLLRFALTNNALVLSHRQTWVVGVTAHSDSRRHGDLYVPTAPFAGPSDVQAGNFLIGGWRNIADAGGSTIYWGQLATELWVQSRATQPALMIQPAPDGVQLSWPASAGCFTLEATDELGPAAQWRPVPEAPLEATESFTLTLPATGAARWFRLVK